MFTKQQHQQPQFRLNEFHMVHILRCTCVYILFSLSVDRPLRPSRSPIFHVFSGTALEMNLMILFKIIIISSNYVIIISVKMNVLLHNNAATPITALRARLRASRPFARTQHCYCHCCFSLLWHFRVCVHAIFITHSKRQYSSTNYCYRFHCMEERSADDFASLLHFSYLL